MLITTLRTTSNCPDDGTCPSVHRTAEHPDRLYVITKRVDDPAITAAFAHLVADDELLGFVPADLLPEV
ncbi:hypothetical protein [Pseudonocardia sp. HH130630-07]|uniref:hypothetical protein n=1 Tax=Pseudonocardia sp. HH130630-07 TaxID=1690815 RepID=UPI000814D0A9|nr:hypothetical protein [Pseudonocardia sp. HH130630-07]ANY06586.1 hypothetical protein AFB00_10100 [Pseudonocardia sp. HH130630-07]